MRAVQAYRSFLICFLLTCDSHVRYPRSLPQYTSYIYIYIAPHPTASRSSTYFFSLNGSPNRRSYGPTHDTYRTHKDGWWPHLAKIQRHSGHRISAHQWVFLVIKQKDSPRIRDNEHLRFLRQKTVFSIPGCSGLIYWNFDQYLTF